MLKYFCFILLIILLIFDTCNRIYIWKNKEFISKALGDVFSYNPISMPVSELIKKDDSFLDKIATLVVVERVCIFILILLFIIDIIL